MTQSLRFADLLADIDGPDADLLERANAYYKSNSAAGPVKDCVRKANKEMGTDFATAVLYNHFVSNLPTSPLVAPNAEVQGAAPPPLVVVPGAFHEEHPEAGGDGRAVRTAAQQYGWEYERIPTASLGTLDQNATTIINWLELRCRPVVLVSLSKGTSDVTTALVQRPDLASKVTAWISVSGILVGTQMSDWLLDRKRLRPVLWIMKWKHQAEIQAVRDLRAGKNARLPTTHARLRDPPLLGIPKYHFAGFPLRRHLSGFRARLWHRRFRQQGPNDSVVLLEDLLEASGTVIPVWGADHYLKTSWDSSGALAAIYASATASTTCRKCQ